MKSVRRATVGDIKEIIPLAVKFLDESPMSKTTIDKNGLSTFLEGFINSDNSEVWVIEEKNIVGMSGMMIFPFYANPNFLIAQELFWFIDKEHRGEGQKLLDEMESWAKEKKANSMHMISLETKTVKVMDRYYKRSGYTPIEHTYSKEL